MPEQLRRIAALIVAALFAAGGIWSGTAMAQSLPASLGPAGPRILIERWPAAEKFHAALNREAAAELEQSRRCGSTARADCPLAEWRGWLAGLAGKPSRDQIAAVNAYVNGFRERADAVNWGATDYWASAAEFFSRGGGDCEDFALAKYVSLRSLGVADADMRVLVVNVRRQGLAHAVLLVRTGQEVLVLDNLMRRVVSWADAEQKYEALYSVNAAASWLHASRAGVSP